MNLQKLLQEYQELPEFAGMILKIFMGLRRWPCHARQRPAQNVMKPTLACHDRPPAMTLVEVLVVVVIIGILIALLLPALSRAKSRAAVAECISNQKQIAIALLLYAENDPAGAFPSTNLVIDPTRSLQSGTNAITWSYRLFVEAELGATSEAFRCPADTFSWFWPSDGDAFKGSVVVFTVFGTSYGFNGWNFLSNTPPPWSGLAGVPMDSVRQPERTVLTYEHPILTG